MNGFTLLIGSAVIFLIAYVVYGSWLAKQWGIDPTRKTPAETQKDGIDYLPTKPAVLLGHHFSSIAGAGPIVGPITAAVFGWVPVTLWIIVGSVFFGGVHDYGSLVASLRHKGKSIGQIIEANIGEKAKILFAIFACNSFINRVCFRSISQICETTEEGRSELTGDRDIPKAQSGWSQHYQTRRRCGTCRSQLHQSARFCN